METVQDKGLLDALKGSWQKWNGLGWGPAGLKGIDDVEVRRRNGATSTGPAWVFCWRYGVRAPELDILEWRLAPASLRALAPESEVGWLQSWPGAVPSNPVNAAPDPAYAAAEEVKTEQVDHPAHYNQGGVECIDAIRAALTPEEFRGFCKGNALKYIWRERHKGGAESLEKAAWYLKEAEK